VALLNLVDGYKYFTEHTASIVRIQSEPSYGELAAYIEIV
jgi:hypothetical protein